MHKTNYSTTGLRSLGDERAHALAHLGFRSLSDLMTFKPLHAARTLLAVSRGRLPVEDARGLLDDVRIDELATAMALPAAHLHGMNEEAARVFASIGMRTVSDVAALASELDEAIAAMEATNGFSERPSAPPQLLPGVIGSIASTVRYSSFIRDTELRNLKFTVRKECAVDLPLSTDKKYPASLREIFEQLQCSVAHLGYICDHRQRWINLGTHLGEVVHSIALAPGESRNIAFVNWRRRQITSLEQQTRTSESLSATFVQNRALEEVTSAVAREHQNGGSQTQANTAATAAGVVGALAVGAGIGAAIGTAVTPGIGTAIGATIGAGVAGVAAAGLVHTGAQALGKIESDTDGTRDIVANVQQRISLSTTQNASAVRSLWTTGVVEDAQAESVEATTSNITNYNHMHSLNIEYYEVLQHFLTRVELEGVQPVLYLPFRFLDFYNLRFIRDYWDAVRPHIHEEDLQDQGDLYFTQDIDDGEPPALLPVPPRIVADQGKVTGLRIQLMFTYDKPVSLDLAVLAGDDVYAGVEDDVRTAGDVRTRNFTIPTISDARSITAIRVVADRDDDARLKVTVRILEGTEKNNSETLTLRREDVGSVTFTREHQTKDVSWAPPALEGSENLKKIKIRDARIAAIERINEQRVAAYEQLVANGARFEQRLYSYVVRRRHFFTRVILESIEPEELIQLLESLRIGFTAAGNPDFGIPLSTFADTIPVGITSGAIILRMKRLTTDRIREIARALVIDQEVPELVSLFTYADETLTRYEDPARRAEVATSDHVYLPTAGLFAEAILGRSNSAEYLDMERYFHWQDAPIPHQPPTISPLSTDSRFQRGEVNVTMPEGSLQVINPVAMPDPVTTSGALAALGNGGLFRDMSGRAELAGIISSLTTLAGQIGQSAAGMTGAAAQQALQAASQLGQTAAGLASGIVSDSFAAATPPPVSATREGAALNQQEKLDEQMAKAAQPGSTTPPPSQSRQDIARRAAGLPQQGSGSTTQRALDVSLIFLTERGVPVTFNQLSGIPKSLSLRSGGNFLVASTPNPALGEIELDELRDGFFGCRFEAVHSGQTFITVTLGLNNSSLRSVQETVIEANARSMTILATVSSREVTVTRSRSETRSESLAHFIQTKFGVSAGVATKIAATIELEGSLSGDSTESTTETDSVSETDSDSITETLRVPTGTFELRVVFS